MQSCLFCIPLFRTSRGGSGRPVKGEVSIRKGHRDTCASLNAVCGASEEDESSETG